MPTLDIESYKPVPNTSGDANQVANGFQAIEDVVNGLDSSNWASGKIFPVNKLEQDAAVSGGYVEWDGTEWSAAGGKYRKASAKDVNTSTAEADLLNSEVTIGAGVLGTSRLLRATLIGDYLNNSGGGANLTLKVKIGATLMWGTIIGGGGGIPASATRRPLRIEFVVANLGIATSQWLNGRFVLGAAAAGSAAGFGAAGSDTATLADQWGATFAGTAAENSANALALAVTATHGTSSAQISCRLMYAIVEVI